MTLILKLLEQVPFFWDFSPDERAILADADQSLFANIASGEPICKQGDEDDALIILIDGAASVRIVEGLRVLC